MRRQNPPTFVRSLVWLGALTALGLTGVWMAAPSAGAQASRWVRLQTFKTHSRLTIELGQLVDGLPLELKSNRDGFVLTLNGVTLADLGAPLGAERAWASSVVSGEDLRDARVEGLKLSELANGVAVSGRWRFPRGDLAPADPKMEHFDFRQVEHGRWVLDFWVKPGLTVAQAKARSHTVQLERGRAQTRALASERRNRSLASLQMQKQLEDVAQFCSLPLSDARDIFLAFTPAREDFDYYAWVPQQKPDGQYSYLEPKTDSPESHYVRLALKLYREGKSALAIKTIEFFEKDHPTSPYRTEMRFLRANALMQLGMMDAATAELRTIQSDDRASPAALHSAMFLAVRDLREERYLQALETFLWLKSAHAEHRLAWLFGIGAAEALGAIKQTERAAKEYQWVAEQAPEPALKAQAALRLGDLYLDRLQYDQALAAYFQAAERFPKEAERSPTLALNRAESLYWLGQYERAESVLAQYLEQHPGHPFGWRALYRLSEIRGRRSGDEDQRQSRALMLSVVNRYPFSPGATLARLRLLPCGDHAGFTFRSARRFLETDAQTFNGGGQVILDRYRDYRAVAMVRTLIALGQDQNAVAEAIREIHENSGTAAKRIAGGMLESLFRRTVLDLLNAGRSVDAIAFYQDRISAIADASKDSPYPTSPDYILKLSRAAAELGMGGVAQKLLADYSSSLELATRTGRSVIGVASRDPAAAKSGAASDADIEDRLKQSEAAYTRAQALWISSGMQARAQIDQELERVIGESEFSYPKEVLLGLIAERDAKPATALKHALTAQLLLPTDAATRDGADNRRLRYWIAELHLKAGSKETAIELLRQLSAPASSSAVVAPAPPVAVSGALAALGVPAVPEPVDLHLMLGSVLVSVRRYAAAAQAFEQAAALKPASNRPWYEYARAIEQSDTRGAQELARGALEKASKSSIDDFWKKLAQERLAQKSVSQNQGG